MNKNKKVIYILDTGNRVILYGTWATRERVYERAKRMFGDKLKWDRCCNTVREGNRYRHFSLPEPTPVKTCFGMDMSYEWEMAPWQKAQLRKVG